MHEEELKKLLADHEAIKQHIRHICAIAPRLVTDMLEDAIPCPRKQPGVLTVIGAGESFSLILGERTVVFAVSMQLTAREHQARIQIGLHRNLGIGDAVVTPLGTVELGTTGLANWAQARYDTTNPDDLREFLAYALLLAMLH